MGKALDGLRWKPLWTSHIGCLKGCIDFLGLDVSLPWLFGATGHAFLLNVHELDCPSGPTAWKMERFLELGRNLGYAVDGVSCFRGGDDFEKTQRAAWEMVRSAIDSGLPCYGWELKLPEYYVIYGYDDVGYYYSGAGCDEGEGPKAWQELGASDLGLLAAFKVSRCKPKEPAKQIKDAFKFALEFSQSSEKHLHPLYKGGLDGYDNWIKALKDERSTGIGTAYNAAVWAECRKYAVNFLAEAKQKVGKEYEKLFDDGIAHYRIVAERLDDVAKTFPACELKPAYMKDQIRREKAITALREARRAEEHCLALLAKIHKEL